MSYLGILYIILLLRRASSCVVSFHCYMFCLLFVLAKLSSDWLERPPEEA